jgi:beta-galactosidase
MQRTVVHFRHAELVAGAALVETTASYAGADSREAIRSETRYSFHGDGIVGIARRVRVFDWVPHVPRIGLEFELDEAMAKVRWYGRGPHENYCDRKLSAWFAVHERTVADMFVPYIDPSECGGREDARWVSLTDDSGTGLAVFGLAPFHFSALPHTVEALAKAKHTYELAPEERTVLTIDIAHMGVGGDTGWTPNVHPEYLVRPGIYYQTLAVRPIAPGENAADLRPAVVASLGW